MGVALGLLSSLLWGTSDFGGGLLSRTRSAYAVVGASQACALVVVTLTAVATGGFSASHGWLVWSMLAGAVGSLGLATFYRALAGGTMGVVSPIAALGALVPFVVGLATGERPGALALMGAVVALAGAVLASGPELSGASGSTPVILAATAGVLFGLALVFMAHGARSSAVMTLFGMRMTSVTMFAVAGLLARSLGGLATSDIPVLAAIGVSDMLANLTFGLASQRGFVSIVAVLGSLYPVMTVFLAWAFLHERLQRIQQLGVVLALVGVAAVGAA